MLKKLNAAFFLLSAKRLRWSKSTTNAVKNDLLR